jgi:hypothetical protein
MKAVLNNKKAMTNQVGRIKTFTLYATLLLGIVSQFIPMLNSFVMVSLGATTVLQIDAIINYVITYNHIKSENINNIISSQVIKEEVKSNDVTLSNKMTKKEELVHLRNILLTIKDNKEFVVENNIENQIVLKKRY